MSMAAVTAVINLVGAPIAAWLEGKRKQTEAKADAKIMHAQALIGSKTDVFLLFIWSYPFWSSFVPQLAPHTHAGFQALELLPDWYINGFCTLTGAVFGFSKFDRYRRR